MYATRPIFTVALIAAASLLFVGCPSGDGGNSTATPAATTDGGGGGTNGGGAGEMGTASITGSVKFTGTAPTRKKLRRNSDAICAATEMLDETVIVEDGMLHNVLVRVVDGVSGTYEGGEPITIDQKECMYRPRVAIAMSGAKVNIANSDETLHNVHVRKGKVSDFNKAMPPGADPLEKTFTDGGQVFSFKCDVHPWMQGFVAVADHPFNAVAEDGTYTISKLPAGTYKVEAWHEKYGSKTMDVTVADGATETLDFEFSATDTAMK